MRIVLVPHGRRVVIDVEPLPSRLDAVVFWITRRAWEFCTTRKQNALLNLADTIAPKPSKRDDSRIVIPCVKRGWWQTDAGDGWYGPVPRGGPYHRALMDALVSRAGVVHPIVARRGIIALDWRTGEEHGLLSMPDPPTLPEDDDVDPVDAVRRSASRCVGGRGVGTDVEPAAGLLRRQAASLPVR